MRTLAFATSLLHCSPIMQEALILFVISCGARVCLGHRYCHRCPSPVSLGMCRVTRRLMTSRCLRAEPISATETGRIADRNSPNERSGSYKHIFLMLNADVQHIRERFAYKYSAALVTDIETRTHGNVFNITNFGRRSAFREIGFRLQQYLVNMTFITQQVAKLQRDQVYHMDEILGPLAARLLVDIGSGVCAIQQEFGTVQRDRRRRLRGPCAEMDEETFVLVAVQILREILDFTESVFVFLTEERT